jgi:hypothetical protein
LQLIATGVLLGSLLDYSYFSIAEFLDATSYPALIATEPLAFDL